MDNLWCLLGTSLCFKSEVWAAWWQGAGTVAAFFVAIGVASHQYSAQRQTRAEQDLEERRRIALMCMLFIDALRAVLDKLEVAFNTKDVTVAVRTVAIIEEISEWPARLQLERLSAEGALLFLRIRLNCAGAKATARLAAHALVPEAELATIVEMRRDVNQLREEFFTMHRDLLPP